MTVLDKPRFAWAFLTRLPGGAHPADQSQLGASVPWFPGVGAAIGLLVALAYVALHEVTSSVIAAAMAVGLGMIFTGAFHEDGLADFADSFGGYTQDRRIEIMKDSRVGTFGVAALIIVVIIKVLALGSLDGSHAVVALTCAHMFGRAAAVGAMLFFEPAASGGLGNEYSRAIPRRTALVVVAGVATLLPIVGAAAGSLSGGALAVAVGLIGIYAVGVVATRSLGGVTGDVLGAIEQIVETLTLVVLAESL